MKITHYLSIAVLILGFAALAWFNYALYWPVKTLVISNYSSADTVQTDDTTYHLGQVISYKLDYCKYTTVRADVTRTLIDGQIITLANSTGYLPTGCHNADVQTTVIPTTILPARYYLDIVVRYRVNPLRTEVVEYHTNEFDVVK